MFTIVDLRCNFVEEKQLIMKTNTIKTSKSTFIVQLGLILVAATVLSLSLSFSQRVYGGNQLSFDKQVESNEGIYLASVFNDFKKEKLKSGIYTEQQLSEKVLLKIFIKYMKEKESK